MSAERHRRVRTLLLSLYRALCFFLIMGAVITCCMMLFLNIMMRQTGVELTSGDIGLAARLTFANVIFLSFICTLIDTVRRRFTVGRPVKRIVSAAERMAAGDFSVRIPRSPSLCPADGFGDIAECFNTLAEELDGMETLRTDFIANVSHELKTPLAVMQNYGALLSRPDLPERERLEYAREITLASRRLSDLITNILRLNKLENQKIFPKTQRYDLGEQLCECLLAFEAVWEEKRIDIQTEIQEGVLVESDPELLSLVWNNLFSNALKFTPPQGRVRLTLRERDGEAIVEVADTGCGISPETGEHIFEKFYQGDASRATQGNGLGLALVKRVIDIVGAEISVWSEPERGSVFTVRLGSAADGAA
ncbi:MAG: HAMP domain-containing histidine kinase [Oscillospiraceae bacterium]|nr:HAMP domain-containing histidine kinase [Oscillospiraceae bacterium]